MNNTRLPSLHSETQGSSSDTLNGFSIGATARITGLSVHTLRMWGRRYGLSASQRSKSGQRRYSEKDMERLQLLKSLLDHGLRIGEIASLPNSQLSELLAINYRQKLAAGALEPQQILQRMNLLVDEIKQLNSVSRHAHSRSDISAFKQSASHLLKTSLQLIES